MIRILGVVCGVILTASVASAQGIPAADVKILSINASVVDGQFKCTVQVHNDNDDDAQHVILVVLFPL